ncbi:transposase, partial [Pseudomonas sp. NPDC077382]
PLGHDRARVNLVAFLDGDNGAVRQLVTKTPEYLVSRCERKKVEMLFAHLKRIMKLDRLRLRGLTGATDEFTLAAMVQNLRRMAKLLPQGPPLTG